MRTVRAPCLWLAKMNVVDRVEVHVFRVPAKRCLPHPKVKVRCVDPLPHSDAHDVQASACVRAGVSESGPRICRQLAVHVQDRVCTYSWYRGNGACSMAIKKASQKSGDWDWFVTWRSSAAQ